MYFLVYVCIFVPIQTSHTIEIRMGIRTYIEKYV